MFGHMFNRKKFLTLFTLVALQVNFNPDQNGFQIVNGSSANAAVTGLNQQINIKVNGSAGAKGGDTNSTAAVLIPTQQTPAGTLLQSQPSPQPNQPSPLPSTDPLPQKRVGNGSIDVLDYLISDNLDKGLNGENTGNFTDFINGHPFSQTVSGNKLYNVKWDPSVFETYTWDNNNIYLREDHNGSGDGKAYSFIPGLWLKREMNVGERVFNAQNMIERYDRNCNVYEKKLFPIALTLENHDPNYIVGGDLGAQDVIVLNYDSSVNLNSGVYERYYYSKAWGLVRWEEYDKRTNTLKNRRTFNKITQPIAPNTSLSCR